jgi:transcriptional regulator with XRE-family HTH domain
MAQKNMATAPKLTEELRLLRRRKKWSQKKVADEIMVSPGTIRSWEDGSRAPSVDHVERIQDFIELHTKFSKDK